MQKNGKRVNVIKKVFTGILWAFLGILVVITAWLAVDKFVRKSPVPSFCGYSLLTVQTGSMSGTIEIGDMVLIRKSDDFEIGDVITFLFPDEKVSTTHRIVNVNPDGTFVTKGAANNAVDTRAVAKENIVGKSDFVVRKGGLFLLWLKSEGWIYCVAALFIAGMGTWIVKTLTKTPQEGENDPENKRENNEEGGKK